HLESHRAVDHVAQCQRITDDHHGTNSTVPNWECARERDTTQPPALHDYLLGPANKSGAFFTEPVACEPARSGAADLALRRPKGPASNSRRPMVTVIRPSRARCVKERIPRHERAVPNRAALGADSRRAIREAPCRPIRAAP